MDRRWRKLCIVLLQPLIRIDGCVTGLTLVCCLILQIQIQGWTPFVAVAITTHALFTRARAPGLQRTSVA